MNIIGVAGFARSGKDTFVSIADKILRKNGFTAQRFAFADVLKEEVQGMLDKNDFGLTVYTSETDAKSKIRPLLVWWGCARRDLTEGKYWIDYVERQIKEFSDQNGIALISDVRFPNEVKWLQEKMGGWVVHLRKYKKVPVAIAIGEKSNETFYNAEYDKAPNEEEAKNDPLVLKSANEQVSWETVGENPVDNQILNQIVFEKLNKCPFFNGKLSL